MKHTIKHSRNLSNAKSPLSMSNRNRRPSNQALNISMRTQDFQESNNFDLRKINLKQNKTQISNANELGQINLDTEESVHQIPNRTACFADKLRKGSQVLNQSFTQPLESKYSIVVSGEKNAQEDQKKLHKKGSGSQSMSKLPTVPRPSQKMSSGTQNNFKSPPVTSRLGFICKDFEKNDQKLRQLSSGHLMKRNLEIPRTIINLQPMEKTNNDSLHHNKLAAPNMTKPDLLKDTLSSIPSAPATEREMMQRTSDLHKFNESTTSSIFTVTPYEISLRQSRSIDNQRKSKQSDIFKTEKGLPGMNLERPFLMQTVVQKKPVG